MFLTDLQFLCLSAEECAEWIMTEKVARILPCAVKDGKISLKTESSRRENFSRRLLFLILRTITIPIYISNGAAAEILSAAAP